MIDFEFTRPTSSSEILRLVLITTSLVSGAALTLNKTRFTSITRGSWYGGIGGMLQELSAADPLSLCKTGEWYVMGMWTFAGPGC